MNANTPLVLDTPDVSDPDIRSEREGVLVPSENDRDGERAAIAIASERDIAAAPSLDHLSDDEVLANTRRLVGRSNQIFAALLVHLAEVETRGLHRLRACSSLYTYCIYELRFSEDAAFRRVSAARLVMRFPALLGAIERGELHLTGLLLLGPHLTLENHLDVLVHAKHRTKKEIAKLVRILDPLPEVPARIAPLGPALARSGPVHPSWEQLAHSLNPVRELSPGDRPADWIGAPCADLRGETVEGDVPTNDIQHAELVSVPAPARLEPSVAEARHTTEPVNEVPAPARFEPTVADTPARSVSPLVGPQRYRVQFTASDEYVELVERAKALLSHAVPSAGIEEIHLRAMRAFVSEIEKRKYAVAAPPHAGSDLPDPRQCGRAIPAAVRRAVWSRDQARCTYVDTGSGQRCRETAYLELHHQTAYAQGGPHSASNVTLRCRAHNALAAEADFGREFCAKLKGAARHESYVQEQVPGSG